MNPHHSTDSHITNSSEADVFHYQSELGLLEIISSGHSLLSVTFTDDNNQISERLSELSPFQNEIHTQFDEYFQGKRLTFDVSIKLNGTLFEKQVWDYLLEIPYGQTKSYGDIATFLGDMKKVRAVGRAVGQNPLAIIVPCHRVLGSNGKLTGYAGGLWRKEWLLKHEGSLLI